MTGAYRIAACGIVGLGMLAVAGCATDIPASEFIAKYTTNINVPNPECHNLPVRVFTGLTEEEFSIRDVIPCCQGGGLLGKVVYWQCAAADLPKDFPQAYRPGNLVVDGRPGSQYGYMIEAYLAGGAATKPATTRPAAKEPPAKAAKK